MKHTYINPTNLFVHKGPAAFKFGRYWIGFASGHRSTFINRRSCQKAIEDAKKMETKSHGR